MAPLLNRLCSGQVPGDHADDQQQHDEGGHAGQFGGHREIVDPFRPGGGVGDQQRLHEQYRGGDGPCVARGAGVVEQVGGYRGGDGVVHRDGDDDQEGERHPADRPAQDRVGQPRRPLVGIAGNRDAGGQRAVDQRDRHRADNRDRPGPDPHRAGGVQHRPVGRERPGGDRDEGEGHREGCELPGAALHRLRVAELAQRPALVGSVCHWWARSTHIHNSLFHLARRSPTAVCGDGPRGIQAAWAPPGVDSCPTLWKSVD